MQRREGYMVTQLDNGNMAQKQILQRKWQRLFLHNEFSLFIFGGRVTESSSFTFLIPKKRSASPEFLSTRKAWDHWCFPIISVIMALRSEEIPITNSKRPNRLASHLSSNIKPWRSASMVQIFLIPQASSQAKGIKEVFADFVLPVLSSRLPTGGRGGHIK